MNVLLLDDAGERAHDYLRSILDDSITLVDEPSAEFEIVISGSISAELLQQSPTLHTVILPWVGIPQSFRDILSQDEFKHIELHNSHYNATPVAEFAVTLALSAMKNIVTVDRTLRKGDWRPRYIPSRAFSFRGKRVLILGYGKIGRQAGEMFQALGMSVTAIRRKVMQPTREDSVAIYPANWLFEQLPKTDVLLCALPLTNETRGLIGEEALKLLPNSAVIVNVGRGNVFDEDALYEALTSKQIHAYASDVWYQYPKDEPSRATTHPSKYPLYELDNVVMTPHCGSALADEEDLFLRMDDLARLLNAAANGEEMPNRVDLALGY